jgi:hypothetical protein
MEFDKEKTVAIIFDTEWYVPAEWRSAGRSSLKANPALDGHMFLGGIFVRFFPLDPSRREERTECFAEDLDPYNERDRLGVVYRFFNDSWALTEGNSPKNHDLVTVGTGISRLDLPGLYTRSMIRAIDQLGPLYETYMKTKIVDLSEAAIPYMNRNRPRMLYPVTTNGISARLRLPEERKETGKYVWEMADSGDFDGIRKRVQSEIRVLQTIYKEMVDRIFGASTA